MSHFGIYNPCDHVNPCPSNALQTSYFFFPAGSLINDLDSRFTWGIPHSSVDQESACNAGDLGSIPGWVRSPGEGNGNPPWYSCLENPMDRGAWQAIVHGVARAGHNLGTKLPPPRSAGGFPCGSAIVCWEGRSLGNTGSIPGSGRSPGGSNGDPLQYPLQTTVSWRRKWQLIPVSLPGESQAQRSLVGYSP